jgi:hypothetical protein
LSVRKAMEPDRRLCEKKRTSVFVQKQDGRDFAGVVGRFPTPGARGVAGAEGGLDRVTQSRSVDALALFEMGEKKFGDREHAGGSVGFGPSGSGAAALAATVVGIMLVKEPQGEWEHFEYVADARLDRSEPILSEAQARRSTYAFNTSLRL